MIVTSLRRTGCARAALAAALTTALAAPAFAAEPQLVAEFRDWLLYTYQSGGGKVCYIVSEPKESDPKGVRRDKIYFLVQDRPADKVRSEVTTIIGYNFKQGSTVTVTVDSQSFELFAKADGAWADSSAKDQQIVAAMKKGSTMTVVGTSWRGTRTTDRYSLSGVTAAIDKMGEQCR